MLMIMTVIPVGSQKHIQGDLTQAFDIQDPTGRSVGGRLAEEGALDEIFRFIARCRHRLSAVIGDSVVFVNFQDPEAEESWTAKQEPALMDELGPSLN